MKNPNYHSSSHMSGLSIDLLMYRYSTTTNLNRLPPAGSLHYQLALESRVYMKILLSAAPRSLAINLFLSLSLGLSAPIRRDLTRAREKGPTANAKSISSARIYTHLYAVRGMKWRDRFLKKIRESPGYEGKERLRE